jgi:hypothetical protein
MARYDSSEGFYVLEHAPRVAWAVALSAPLPADAGRNNYSLALSALLPADSGTWLCTLNSRTQYLHATALLIRGLYSSTVLSSYNTHGGFSEKDQVY